MSQTEWIYGIHSVASVLKSQPQRLLRIYVQQGRQDDRVQKLLDGAQRENIEIMREPRKQLDQLAADGNHQGIIAECRPGEQYDEDFLDTLAERHSAALFVLIATDARFDSAVFAPAVGVVVHDGSPAVTVRISVFEPIASLVNTPPALR